MDHRNANSVAQVAWRDDVKPADRIAVRSIVERTGFFHPDEVAVAVELVDERLLRGIESGYHFIFADSAEAVVGYACYGPIACTKGSYDLYWIAVDPRFQRAAIGRQLMAEVESRTAAAGGKRLYIDTSGRPQYSPTHAFYERCGFRCEARLSDFYAPNDDRLIYSKAIIAQN